MMPSHRYTSALFTLLALSGTALAQEPPPPGTPPMPMQPATPPPMGGMPPSTAMPPPEAPPQSHEVKPEKKEPGQGDFDAGAQVRLPNGPDEMGTYGTFNWVAVDAKGRYFLLDSVTINGSVPVALIKPDMVDLDGAGPGGAVEPSMFGGFMLTLDARMPRNPFQKEGQTSGITLGGGWMREGAMLLSEKDFPLYTGDLKPGFNLGLGANVKLGSLLDLKLNPSFFYQQGSSEAINGTQIPLKLVVAIGELVKVSADAGINTGDDFTFRGSKGGRISAGGSLTVKIGPIITHAGAGVASLQDSNMYPSITDSVYIDLNVKYAK